MRTILNEKDSKALIEILVDQLGVTEEQLTPEAKLEADLGADSLSLVEITIALEERFNVSLPDEEWEKVTTVSDVFETLACMIERQKRITA